MKLSNVKRMLVAGAAALAMVAFASPAKAAVIIDFGTGGAGAGGTINIGANVTGSGIFIDTVTIAGAPAGNGVWNVDGAGACATGTNGTCGLLSFDKNANTISITGSIPGLGVAATTLLNGNLSGGLIVTANTGTVGAIQGSGTDTKAQTLLTALGLSPTTQFALFGFSTGFNLTGTGSPYTAVSTDIINTSVPEPGSMILLGTGLLGLGGAIRRRLGR